MTIQRSTLLAAAAALAAGLGWTALGLESIARPAPEPYRDALLLVPWGLTILTLTGIHLMQRERSGGFGTLSWALVVATMLIVAVGQTAAVVGAASLVWLAFPIGLFGWTIAMALFGIAIIRAGVLPRWCGAAVALAEPLTVGAAAVLAPIVPLHEYGSYSGAIAHGLIWLAIGLTLLMRTTAHSASTQPIAMGGDGQLRDRFSHR